MKIEDKWNISIEILNFVLYSNRLSMKMNNLCGLLALSLLCISTAPFSAQVTNSPATEVKPAEPNNGPVVFEYSNIGLSDPTIYSDEPFSITLTVKNTSEKEAKHEVRLLLKDETVPKGLRKQASKFVALRAGQTETITFTFKASDLMEARENMPDVFVFLLGEYEIGIGYEK